MGTVTPSRTTDRQRMLGVEDVRKKAWQLVLAKRDGHAMSPGIAELIDELEDTLNRTAGYRPGDDERAA